MWTFKSQTLNNTTQKYSILEDDKVMSFKSIISYWKSNYQFRNYYNQVLNSISFNAYFWEHPPFSRSCINQQYEFVVTESKLLDNYPADPTPFESYFHQDKKIVSFLNLGKDALLVVPCPIEKPMTYMHLGNFCRHATQLQMNAFWKLVGNSCINQLSHKQVWLNTAGLGVFWLHVRLDTTPKYYKYYPYKIST